MQTEEASGAPKPNERFSRKVKPSTLPPLFAFLHMIRAADLKPINSHLFPVQYTDTVESA